jgi:hypothetical protein
MPVTLATNLFSYEELSTIVIRLSEVANELDQMLSEFHPNQMRDQIQELKSYCEPLLLLDGVQACLTDDSGQIEVLQDMRGISLEDEFFKCETVDWLIDSLSGKQLGTKPQHSPPHPWLSDKELSRFPQEVGACYDSILSSYFSLLDVSTSRREAWNFWSTQVFNSRHSSSDAVSTEIQEEWRLLQRAHFECMSNRSEFLNNLLSAIRKPIGNAPTDAPQACETSQLGFGFVYFVRNGDLHKIGITENLLRRLAELQPDEVLNVVRCKNFQEVERRLHSEFKAIRLPQTEYFRMQPSHIEETHALLHRLADT